MRCTECQEPPRTNSSKNGTQWSGGLGNRRVAEHASAHDFQKSHSVIAGTADRPAEHHLGDQHSLTYHRGGDPLPGRREPSSAVAAWTTP
jgi:hypothetical protein